MRYWRTRLDFESALSCAQRAELPEGNYHPPWIQKTATQWSVGTVKRL
jgi:hypothetical protein